MPLSLKLYLIFLIFMVLYTKNRMYFLLTSLSIILKTVLNHRIL